MGNALAAKPMFRAAKDGDVGQLERLLYIPGTDVNDHDDEDNSNFTSLHYAAVFRFGWVLDTVHTSAKD